MTEVFLHIYDVTCNPNSAVVRINELLGSSGIRLGGIFHCAVQVYGSEEWSFGHRESGSGVFSCLSKQNPLYRYRESISLGRTLLPRFKVAQILSELKTEWPGNSYNYISRNCNDFCDAFCQQLGLKKLPAWVNRFAHFGSALVGMVTRVQELKKDIVSAGKVVYHLLVKQKSVPVISHRYQMSSSLLPNSRSKDFHMKLLKTPGKHLKWLFGCVNCFPVHREIMVERTYIERL